MQVTIYSYDIKITQIPSPVTINSEPPLTKHTHNVSLASTSYSPIHGPQPIELRQILLTKDTPESPTPSDSASNKIFWPYGFPDTPPATNNLTISSINTVVQKLQKLALHANSEVAKQTSGCIVCGKSYEQVIEGTTADHLQQTTEAGETIRERHLKGQAIIDGLQSGLITFIPSGVSQAAACDGKINNISNRNTTQGNLLALCQD